ncbi:MAG: putative hydrophobic protein (TIGR00271 family) [Actinomycetes bacterium]
MDRLSVTVADIDRMADKTLLSFGPNTKRKYSAFWVLLSLAAVIAGAGVVQDSTATVIGAMIVAPLMTPILGTAFAFVLADRYRMLRSGLVVLGGAGLVIGVGFLFGLLDVMNNSVVGNSEVTSRTNPDLLNLIAALATGLVGAFALARSDVADTLPGVAIAISLVPPLIVVGLTWQDGFHDDARGALLLFLTNLTAMIFTATIVLLAYQVRTTAKEAGFTVGKLKGTSLAVVIAAVVVISIPLAIGSAEVFFNSKIQYGAAPTVNKWAADEGWTLTEYSVTKGTLHVTALGAPPKPGVASLRSALDAAGFEEVDVEVELVVGGVQSVPGDQPSRSSSSSVNSP